MSPGRVSTFFVLAFALLELGCSTPRFRQRTGTGDAEQGREITQNNEPPMKNNDPRIKKIRAVAKNWRWPLRHPQLTSRFGHRDDRQHEGIDLRASSGTPIYAAHAGRVWYAGDRISGYGNMIVLRSSSSELSTVYAHASRILVREGAYVKRGARIALSGATGRSTGPHLHFEVRLGSTPVDPLAVMPRVYSMPAPEMPRSGRKLASVKPAAKKKKRRADLARLNLGKRS